MTRYRYAFYFVFFTLFFAGKIKAQNLDIVNAASEVTFRISNLGVNVSGKFTGFSGEIKYYPGNVEQSTFVGSVNAETVDTGINLRDRHLRNEDYFDVEKFPVIRFVSESSALTETNKGLTVTGTLTIKGISKKVVIPLDVKETSQGYTFVGGLKINRRDFGVGGGSLTLSDIVYISFKIQTSRQSK